jgi:hypothetical protein
VKPFHKVALIVGGYVVCLVLAAAAVSLRIALTSSAETQSSGGMYGFGDLILFVAVFGVSALVPTVAALLLLRANRPFWTALSASGVAIAATGVAAAILFAATRGVATPTLPTWTGLSVPRILVSPLLALAFLVCGALAPHRAPRLALFIAAAMEAAVCACAVSFWFLHSP